MHSLAVNVGDLKNVLTNVKIRGTWGEYQLGHILEQMLSPEQYEYNAHRTRRKTCRSGGVRRKDAGTRRFRRSGLPADRLEIPEGGGLRNAGKTHPKRATLDGGRC